ncbi:hypothetical protein HGRIS_014655 [Hohenbuehelia grisea]|uniref:Uncharacterized protein n=1 Tax=Hohenbuehelia grisea TaxID=104357 RepID=A0ABR3JV19_9AGAR
MSIENVSIPTPHCLGMKECDSAASERARVASLGSLDLQEDAADPLTIHLSHGLAYTVGSAIGQIPPSTNTCLAAFIVPNKVGLTAGARAWSKHAHRSQVEPQDEADAVEIKKKTQESAGWWGTPSGPVASINERALVLFWRIMDGATWRNLHWLPHQILVYEARVAEGYGMRWAQDRGKKQDEEDQDVVAGVIEPPWIFRGFVEPMMENGHELGWRHSVSPT